ncbi:hypothetical protein QNS29_000344 [Vibrio parahaemolyticus]|nr:hypothetical protein [Vibrio parahaemolyticus]
MATEILDGELNQQIDELIKYRFFSVFPTVEFSVQLGKNLLDDGTFANTSAEVRSRACAWVARLLSFEESQSNLISNLIDISKKIYSVDEQVIADSFIESNSDNVRDITACLLRDTTPERLSAAFMLLRKYDSNLALSWFYDSNISINDFFIDGKISLLTLLISERKWEKALYEVNQLDFDNLPRSPALKYFIALILLCSSVVVPARAQLLKGVPVLSRAFPFQSDATSIDLRKRAVEIFRSTYRDLVNSDLDSVKNLAYDYALWIELNDRETFSNAKATIEEIFSSDKNIDDAIRILPLIGDLDLEIDFSLLESEVHKRMSITLGNDYQAVLAKYALILRNTDPKVVVYEIERNIEFFSKYIELNSILMLKVQAQKFMGNEAVALKECEELYEKGQLTQKQIEHFRNIVDVSENAEKISILEDKYLKSKDFDDLAILVSFLKRFKDSRLEKYQEIYFSITKNIDDAEGLISVYNSNRKLDKISKFLEKNSDLIPQSTQLQIHLAWDYYRKGDVHECREVLSKYFPQNEGSRYLVDELEDSLNLCTGDWDALAKNIELAWENRDSLTAKELFRKSSLAEAVLPNRARKFVIEAVSKEPNNPDILTAGYSVATNLGLDEKEEVIEWLRKAISISGDSGPIKKISLEEIGEVLLSNREAPNKAWELFLSGEVPTTLAAANLNRSISSFIITPWIINTNELEVNKKLLIPAYSLKREIIDILPEVIALELTAILSLSNIGLLELTITSFKKVIIAHSTLLSIFNDRKKTAFHQPSQIELAKCIIEETKKFSVFKYDSVRDIEFRSKINDESAEFISHAMEENIDLVRLVCISEPVYVANSLMKEEFDLAPYRHCLVSIGRIIRFLYECGMIMLVEAKEKLEKIDPGACIDNIRCDIKPGSELYIDRLSCHKLHKLGLLSLLGDSSLQCYISEMHDNENKKLVEFEEKNEKVLEELDSIRKILNKYIIEGKVKLTELNRKEVIEDESYSSCIEIFSSSTPVDAILTDDICINKFKNVKINNVDVPTINSWDLLRILHQRNVLSGADVFRKKISIIEKGYIFCTLSESELDTIFDSAMYSEEGIIEGVELKALRLNMLLIKSSGFVELPRDAEWLIKLMSSFSNYLKKVWDRYEDDQKCVAISNWLFKLIDYKTWAGCYTDSIGESFVQQADMTRINSLLNSCDITRSERRSAYQDWLTSKVLHDVKYNNPNLYRQLLVSSRHMILETVNEISDKIEGNYRE